ncbi:MAG: MFS transporter, partial [Bacillota bacterium]|nr:MFS transporter [Bacillota bacterium]
MNRGRRTFILLVIAMVLGYLPWYNFSAVLPYLATDFSLTSGQTGLILSAFQAGYVMVVLATGRLADRIGPQKVAAWATLCTAIASTL